METKAVNKSQIKVGVKVNTTDGDNGIVQKINDDHVTPFPFLIKFKDGYAWQGLWHIKEIVIS
jgi:uncharacterized protein YkvS